MFKFLQTFQQLCRQEVVELEPNMIVLLAVFRKPAL